MRRVGVFYRECITVFAQLSARAQPGFPAEEPSNMTGIQCDHELCITGLHKNLWLETGDAETLVGDLPQFHGGLMKHKRKLLEVMQIRSLHRAFFHFFKPVAKTPLHQFIRTD